MYKKQVKNLIITLDIVVIMMYSIITIIIIFLLNEKVKSGG